MISFFIVFVVCFFIFKITHLNHHVNKALNKLMCRIIKTVMNYQN